MEVKILGYPVIKGSSYILVHAPNILKQGGSTQTTTRKKDPNDPYLSEMDNYLRDFDEFVGYGPNQAYIGNILPEDLKDIETPWYDKDNLLDKKRDGEFGEIMPEDQFITLIKHVDVFDLVKLSKDFVKKGEQLVKKHPILKEMDIDLGEGEDKETLEKLLDNH